ncbi:MAG: methyltransferase domain-containing protein [Ginsengibacter sp.]
MKVLEVGADTLPTWYCKAVNKPSIEWYTLDIKTHWDTLDIGKGKDEMSRQIVSNLEYDYPVDDNTFDIVFSGQVMEHVKNIWKWMDELKRITKKGGLIITILPVSWPYHVAPAVVDCWRIYPEGMKALVEEKGLEILVNTFESLEKNLIPSYVPTRPGIGVDLLEDLKKTGRKSIFFYYRILYFIPFLRRLRMPVSVSYDAVCVCKKV